MKKRVSAPKFMGMATSMLGNLGKIKSTDKVLSTGIISQLPRKVVWNSTMEAGGEDCLMEMGNI
jgi:hypothetical protein